MTRFAAVVLAAGLARRMGGPNKLLLSHRGRTLVAWSVSAACASHAERVVLITGRDGDAVADAVGADAKLARVHNSRPEDGLSTSLKLGLAQLADFDCVAVMLGDMPEIEAALLDQLFAAWRDDAYALAPSFEGEIGNPALLGADAMRDCATLSGDRGARKLLEAQMDRVIRAPVQTRAIFADFDSPEDFT